LEVNPKFGRGTVDTVLAVFWFKVVFFWVALALSWALVVAQELLVATGGRSIDFLEFVGSNKCNKKERKQHSFRAY
jgi:hypothetical protein